MSYAQTWRITVAINRKNVKFFKVCIVSMLMTTKWNVDGDKATRKSPFAQHFYYQAQFTKIGKKKAHDILFCTINDLISKEKKKP